MVLPNVAVTAHHLHGSISNFFGCRGGEQFHAIRIKALTGRSNGKVVRRVVDVGSHGSVLSPAFTDVALDLTEVSNG